MEKLKDIFTSSRFLVAIATIIGIIASEGFGIKISTEELFAIVAIVIAWITGKTIRPGGTPAETPKAEEKK